VGQGRRPLLCASLLVACVAGGSATGLSVATAAGRAAPDAVHAPTATATTLRLTVSRSAWFSQQQPGPVEGISPPTAPDPTVPADGSLAVAGPVTGTPPRPRKEAYIGVDLAAVPAAARVTGFIVVLPAGAQTGPLPALVAVAATSAFGDKQFNRPASGAPTDDTATSAPLVLEASTPPRYTMSSAALGQRLVDRTATGIGLRPADAMTTEQAVLAPASAVTVDLTYSTVDGATDAATTAVTGGTAPNSIAAVAPATPTPARSAAVPTPTSRQALQAGSPATAAAPAGTSGAEAQSAGTLAGAPVAIAAAPLSAALPAAAAPAALPGVAAAQPAVAPDGAPTQDSSGSTTGAVASGLRPVAALRSGGAEGAPLTLLLAILLLLGVLAVAATSLTLPAVAPERGPRRPTRPPVRRERARPLP